MARDGLLILHILLLVAWLGIDVGVFYGSFVMRRPGLTPEARAQVRKMMTSLDLAPRLSLILMIPVALGLARVSGFGFGTADPTLIAALLWAVTILALVWVAASVWAFRRRQEEPTDERLDSFNRSDISLRILASVAFVVMGVTSLSVQVPFAPTWLALKALLFGVVIAAGLWIRVAAARYRPALTELLELGETPERLAAVNSSIPGVYPAVLFVWGALVVMVILAVARP